MKKMELYYTLQLLRFSLLHNLLTFAFLFFSMLAKNFYILCSIIYVYLYKRLPLYIISLTCNVYMYTMIMPLLLDSTSYFPHLLFQFSVSTSVSFSLGTMWLRIISLVIQYSNYVPKVINVITKIVLRFN